MFSAAQWAQRGAKEIFYLGLRPRPSYVYTVPSAPQRGQAEREHYGKARFEWLNLAARAMGDLAIGFSRTQLTEGVNNT